MLFEMGNVKCRLSPVCAGMEHRLYSWFSAGSCNWLIDSLRRDRMNLPKYFLYMEHDVKCHMMKSKRWKSILFADALNSLLLVAPYLSTCWPQQNLDGQRKLQFAMPSPTSCLFFFFLKNHI